jgi:UDP-glucuronate 4-epimerase
MTIVVSGAAGFIGFHVAQHLLARGETVIGIDNVNDYYNVALKEARLARLTHPRFSFRRIDITDREAVEATFRRDPDITGIIHLAAQAGVRYSLVNPYAYVNANVLGHLTLMEAARQLPRLACFVYASSSSVYGGNTKLPFSITDRVDTPISLYAATKRAYELMTQSHCHLYGMAAAGLRFFTVYGPWGRPDMAAYLFADAIVAGRPIDVFNEGRMCRDFTYVDDIVRGTVAALDRPPPPDSAGMRHRIYNLGNHCSERLLDFIETIECLLGRTVEKRLLPLQPGDVPETYADIEESRRDLGFEPTTPISEGLPRFIAWYKDYHRIA